MSKRIIALFICICAHAATAATISVYISGPSVQSSFVAGGVTETFDSLAPALLQADYISPIGTYRMTASSSLSIEAPNQFGGADNGSGTTTRYAAVGAQSGTAGPIVLDLTGPQDYFGFWWSAGDPNNGVSFYNGSALLARFSSADLIAALSPINGRVTAIDGSRYRIRDYYGNPNTGQNTDEPYAYVHAFTSGTTFDRLVFDNSGSLATGFESDNHTVHLGSSTVAASSVFIQSIAVADVAEPATTGLALIGLSLVLGASRRRKHR
jgi:hypothetical protein